MGLLIKNIKGLIQVREKRIKWVAGEEMGKLPVQNNAYLVVSEEGYIEDYGPMEELSEQGDKDVIDANEKYVMPAFVDSHSHIVFANYREDEFVDRIKGLSYAEIARRGGGILNSAKKMQYISEEELYQNSMERIKEVIGFGTGALEIKSGYGLSVENELKMLRVVKKISETSPLTIKATFLGAHAIPKEYENRKDYIDLIIKEMMPQIAEEGLADYCDVFCEEGFFSREETIQIAEAGKTYGMKPKIHANQLHRSGGVQAGVKTKAISVDHLECVGEEEINALKGTDTMPTFLPGAAFFLGTDYPPARKMIDEGLPAALASDYNPGSAPCGKMSLILSLACVNMKMTPEEVINASTINSAYAMEVGDTLGSITRGKKANLIITKNIPSIGYIPYAFGSDFIDKVILNGEIQNIN